MIALVRRHLPEAILADLAEVDGGLATLTATDRLHLDTCDRCQSLLEGHRRVLRVLASPWRVVTVTDLAASRGVQPVRGQVHVGSATGHLGVPPWAAVVAAALTVALLGAFVLTGGSRPVDRGGVIAVPSAADTSAPTAATTPAPRTPAPTPIPTPVDTTGWVPFESSRYRLTIEHPADWEVLPATRTYDPSVESFSGFLMAVDQLRATGPAASLLVYGWLIPTDTSPDAFLQDYLASGPSVPDPCRPLAGTWVAVTIDGHAGWTSAVTNPSCSESIEAVVIVGRRAWFFTGLSGLIADRAMFDALVASVRLHPDPGTP